MKKSPQKESRKPLYRVAAPDARPCRAARLPVHRRTVVRLGTHGQPCTGVPVLAALCPAVHPCGTPVRSLFSAVLLSLMLRASSNLYFSSKSSQNATLLVKPEGSP